MSGHSKWATIHRQKEANDAKRGNLFSKLSRAITIAAKSGGGADPESNFKLRVAIDKARASNMPKENIDRAISKASAGGETMEEVTYEGFAPNGVSVIVDAVTDNRNRTSQEIKNIFDKGGGNLAGPGAVSYNFEQKGLIVIKKDADAQSQMLKLIDLGVEDVEETDDGIEIYTSNDQLANVRQTVSDAGFDVVSVELTLKPKTTIDINDQQAATRVLNLLGSLQELEDVQKVYANLNISDSLVA